MSRFNVWILTENVAYDEDRISLVSAWSNSELNGSKKVHELPGQLVMASNMSDGAIQLRYVQRADKTAPVAAMPPASTDAVRWAQNQYRGEADPLYFLPERFTMYQLRLLHVAIFGPDNVPLKDTFRRIMLPTLKATGEFIQQTHGRPAELFERAE